MEQIASTKVHYTLTHTDCKTIDPPLEERTGEHFVHIPENGAERQLTSGRVDIAVFFLKSTFYSALWSLLVGFFKVIATPTGRSLLQSAPSLRLTDTQEMY